MTQPQYPYDRAQQLWTEKLAFFLEQEAITSDPVRRFELKKQIEEAREKIQKLSTNTIKPAQTPRELREEEVAHSLWASNLTSGDLAAIEEINDWPRSLPEADPFGHFARALLQADFETDCEALRRLARRKPSAWKALLYILDIVAPFWIKESEAAPVAQIALSEREKRLLALDVVYPYSPRAFICRAYMMPLNHGWRVCNLHPPTEEDSLGSLKRQVLQELQQGIDVLVDSDLTTLELILKEGLLDREKEGEPVFLLFPRAWAPDPALLSKIRAEFPTLTVMAIAKAGLLDQFHDLLSPGEQREAAAWKTYIRTKTDLKASPA